MHEFQTSGRGRLTNRSIPRPTSNSATGRGAPPSSGAPGSWAEGEASVARNSRVCVLGGFVVGLPVGEISGSPFGQIVVTLGGECFMPVVGALTGGLGCPGSNAPLTASVVAP